MKHRYKTENCVLTIYAGVTPDGEIVDLKNKGLIFSPFILTELQKCYNFELFYIEIADRLLKITKHRKIDKNLQWID